MLDGDGPDSRACLQIEDNLNYMQLRNNCSSDLTTAKIQWTGESGARNLLLGSVCLPFDQEGPPPTPEVRTLMAYAGKRKRDLLFVCDANAHHNVWGSTGINRRGELEVIDITVCTPRLAMSVKQWHVSNKPSLSDHRYM